MPAPSNEGQSPLKLLAWALSVAGSSLITLALKSYWDTPRPHIELTRLEVRRPETRDSIVSLNPELDNRIRLHRFFPTIDTGAKSSEVANSLVRAKQQTALARRALQHLDALIGLVKTQSAAMGLANRRKEFLQTYCDKDLEQDFIEAYALLTSVTADLPEKYQAHPNDAKRLTVKLSRSSYNLTELDEDAIASGAVVRDPEDPNAYAVALGHAQQVNRWRRILAYYEPDILVPFLSAIRETVEGDASSAEALTHEVQGLLDSAADLRLAADVLVSNKGGRPLAIRNQGALRLLLPENQGGGATVNVSIGVPGQEDGVTIIEAGGATSIAFSSKLPLASIVAGEPRVLGGDGWVAGADPNTSRLLHLWQAKPSGLRASVVLGRAGVEAARARAGESEAQPVGQSVDEEVARALME